MASNLVNTCKRYKAGTEKLARWLMQFAERCDITVPQTKSRVSAFELLLIAKRITRSTKPEIHIPIDILDVAKDAVQGRRSCVEWYDALAKGHAESSGIAHSNAQQQHFLSILKTIFELLRKAFKLDRSPSEKQPTCLPELAGGTKDMTSLDSHLEFEEPTTDSEESVAGGGPANAPPKRTKGGEKRQAQYRLEDEQGERHVAIWCLLKDLFVVRMFVRDMWERYRQGELSFFATSRMANIAFDVIVQTTDHFGKYYPDLDSFEGISSCIGAESFTEDARCGQFGSATTNGSSAGTKSPAKMTARIFLVCQLGAPSVIFDDVATFLWKDQLVTRHRKHLPPLLLLLRRPLTPTQARIIRRIHSASDQAHRVIS